MGLEACPMALPVLEGISAPLRFQALFAIRCRDLVAMPRLRRMFESIGVGCGQLWAAWCRNAASPTCPKDVQTLSAAGF